MTDVCLLAMQGIHCNLHTGQEKQVLAGAKHTSCTIEMVNTTKQWDCAVIDEIQVRKHQISELLAYCAAFSCTDCMFWLI